MISKLSSVESATVMLEVSRTTFACFLAANSSAFARGRVHVVGAVCDDDPGSARFVLNHCRLHQSVFADLRGICSPFKAAALAPGIKT
jgi:hypothetical protein